MIDAFTTRQVYVPRSMPDNPPKVEEFRLPEDKAAILAESKPPAWVYLRGIMSAQSSTAIRKAKAKAAPSSV